MLLHLAPVHDEEPIPEQQQQTYAGCCDRSGDDEGSRTCFLGHNLGVGLFVLV
jgi:hypothetical protein